MRFPMRTNVCGVRPLGLFALAVFMAAWAGCAATPQPKPGEYRLNEVTIRGEKASARGETKVAIKEYYEALLISQRMDDGAATARSLNNIGCVLYTEGQRAEALNDGERAGQCYEEALRNYQDAFRAYGRLPAQDWKGMAACQGNIGSVYAAQKKWAEAVAAQEAALALDVKANNPDGQAKRWNNLCFIYRITDRKDKAEECLARIKGLIPQCQDKTVLAAYECSLGSLCEKEDAQGALGHYQRAADLDKEAGNSAGLAVDLHNGGRMAEKLRRFKEARDYYERALFINQALNNPYEDIQEDFDRVAKQLGDQAK